MPNQPGIDGLTTNPSHCQTDSTNPNVQPDINVWYQVTVIHQSELPPFGPPLPIPAIFSHSPYLRSWILSKMINGELCAYRSAVFNQRHRDAYRGLVQDLVTKFEKGEKHKKPLGSTKITQKVGGFVSKLGGIIT